MAVAAAENFTAVLSEDGTLYVLGEHPLRDVSKGLTPERMDGPRDAVALVAAGGLSNHAHAGIVTVAGDLWMYSYGGSLGQSLREVFPGNFYAQLFDGDVGIFEYGWESGTTPPAMFQTPNGQTASGRSIGTPMDRALFGNDKVLMVTCGNDHAAVLTEGGAVYTFGTGGDGRLGYACTSYPTRPRRVPAAHFSDERVVMLAAGGRHTVALCEEGHVYTWGWGRKGQLGHNDRESQFAPRKVASARFEAHVVFVAAGGDHTVAMTAGGELRTWGCGEYGCLGLGTTDDMLVPTLVGPSAFGGSAVAMASCGRSHTLVVTTDGAVWSSGCGGSGQLGLNDAKDHLVFARVGAAQFAEDKVIAAAAGAFHSAAVTASGALWTWGLGRGGRLGLGDEQRRLVPTRVDAQDLQGARMVPPSPTWCSKLPRSCALAFAMGTHWRLGGGDTQNPFSGSPVQSLAVEPALVGLILGFGHRMPEWGLPQFKKPEGLVRLLGGGGMFGAEEEREQRARGRESVFVEDAGVEVPETVAGEGGVLAGERGEGVAGGGGVGEGGGGTEGSCRFCRKALVATPCTNKYRCKLGGCSNKYPCKRSDMRCPYVNCNAWFEARGISLE